jgi:hypothetical protein
MTPGYALSKPHIGMPSMAKQLHKQSAGNLETQWNSCMSTKPTQTADSTVDNRADYRANATFPGNTTRLNQ